MSLSENSSSVESSPVILLVDDNKDNRLIIERLLGTYPKETISVGSGNECLQTLSDRKDIDIILLDIEMPGISGLEVLEEIRKNFSITDLPVILITNHDAATFLAKGLGLGANDFLQKPVEAEEMIARVDAHYKVKLDHDSTTSLKETLEKKLNDRSQQLVYSLSQLSSSQEALKLLKKSAQSSTSLLDVVVQLEELADDNEATSAVIKSYHTALFSLNSACVRPLNLTKESVPDLIARANSLSNVEYLVDSRSKSPALVTLNLTQQLLPLDKFQFTNALTLLMVSIKENFDFKKTPSLSISNADNKIELSHNADVADSTSGVWQQYLEEVLESHGAKVQFSSDSTVILFDKAA